MPAPGKQWYQIVLNTHRSWLHGDSRGFRSKDHRIHSSGDYKAPPPPGEHAGLHRHEQRFGPPVRLPQKLWPIIGETLIEKVRRQGHRLLVVSVDAMHAHLLVELPPDRKAIKRIVGLWKQAASHAVRDVLPGRVWSEDCDPQPMRDRAHQLNTFHYILSHAQRTGAWVWHFKMEGDWE